MIITESALRKIIREEILNEVPLDFTGDFKVPSDSVHRKDPRPSIGRAGLKLKSYQLKAKGMFQDTKHSWAIITLSDTRSGEKTVKSPEFKQWLQQQGISPNTRILVVLGSHLAGDYKNVNWAIGHDIFGHTISTFANRTTPKFSKQDFDSNGEPVDSHYNISEIIEGALWKVIPKELRLGDADGDRLPDVLLAIFLGKLDRETAIVAAKVGIEEEIPAEDLGPKDNTELWAKTFVDHYFKSVKDWIESINPGVPMLINPFAGYIYVQDTPEEQAPQLYDDTIPF